jgi:phage-related protein
MKVPKRIPALFFQTERGNEPAREFLRGLEDDDRQKVGDRIKLVEYAWPVGMPTTRSLGEGLHEVRVSLANNRICRVFFYVSAEERMILLHIIIKKTGKTPAADLNLARERMNIHRAAAKAAPLNR